MWAGMYAVGGKPAMLRYYSGLGRGVVDIVSAVRGFWASCPETSGWRLKAQLAPLAPIGGGTCDAFAAPRQLPTDRATGYATAKQAVWHARQRPLSDIRSFRPPPHASARPPCFSRLGRHP